MASITSALQVWHPEFSAEKIQGILNVPPQISYSVGDEIIRPNGEKLGKRHRTSYLCYDILPLQSELDLESVIEKCNDFISCNIKNKELLKIINETGGSISYYIAIYSQEHLAFQLDPKIIQCAGNLGIGIGVEIFTDWLEDRSVFQLINNF